MASGSPSPSPEQRLALQQAPASASTPFQRQARSAVWKFFTRDVAQQKATCNLCEEVLAYNGSSTSSLQRHLKMRHPSSDTGSSSAATSSSSSSSKQPSIASFAQAKTAKSRPLSVVRSREITKCLSRWMWLDGRPLSIVRDKGLKELFELIEPEYVLPSHTHVSALIRKDHEDGVTSLKELLKSADHVALTTDIWTSKATQAFATTTAHFIDADWNMVACTLETTAFPGSHTGIKISEQIKSAVKRFDIEERKIAGIVHDQAANVELAGNM